MDGHVDENGQLELGEEHRGEDIRVAVLENCSHPEDQVITRMYVDGKGRCKNCNKTIQVSDL